MTSRPARCWQWYPSCSARRSWPRSGPHRQPFVARWWKHWNMNKYPLACLLVALIAVPLLAAETAQEIVDEAQRRATTKSERYEGLLESFNASGKKTSEKRWIFQRVGAHGQSKSII